MENEKKYSTHTDQRWYAAYTSAIFLALGASGGIAMWLWLKIPGPALMVSGVCIFLMIVMGLILARQSSIRLDFAGDELHIHNSDGNYYYIYDVPASDFVCSQNFLEKKHNAGRIKVKSTIFCFYGVQNYSDTCRYIRDNFPNS